MRSSFKKALKVWGYLSVLFTIGYWVYAVVDDYIFIEKYGMIHWQEYLGIWGAYFLVYFIAFSIYFWIAAAIVILVYYKLVKQKGTKLL